MGSNKEEEVDFVSKMNGTDDVLMGALDLSREVSSLDGLDIGNITIESCTDSAIVQNVEIVDCTSINTVNQQNVSKDCSSSLKSIFLKQEPTEADLNSYVYNALRQYPEGELQLQYFYFEKNKENRTKLLDKKGKLYFSTSTVAKVLILHEVRRTQSWSISPERFIVLADDCAQLFEGTLKEGFYTRSTSDRSASGTLQRSYEYLREKAIAVTLIEPTRPLKRKEFEEKDYSKEFEELRESIQVIDAVYVQKWNSTAVNERKLFYKKNNETEIFRMFPNLASPAGYILVQEDFHAFFGKPNDLFEKNWPSAADKIIKLAQNKKRDIVIKEILKLNADCIQKGKLCVLALKLLPYLFKKIVKQTIKSSTHKNWYPDKEEVEKSFILHIKDSQRFTSLLEAEQMRLKQLHIDHKLIVRPYVVICGEVLSTITSSFVVVGACMYQFPSPTQAVDVCLKFYKVFDLPFSHICSHVWQFILKYVYEIEVPQISKGSVDLIENLKKNS